MRQEPLAGGAYYLPGLVTLNTEPPLIKPNNMLVYPSPVYPGRRYKKYVINALLFRAKMSILNRYIPVFTGMKNPESCSEKYLINGNINKKAGC